MSYKTNIALVKDLILENLTSQNISAAIGYTPANGANYLALTGGTLNGDHIP